MALPSAFKKPLIVATSRLIKLLANITKLFGYAFHAVLPNKRFTLPAHATPWLSPRQSGPIPHTIWQTNFTDQVTLPVYLNYLFNRLMAPRFEYRFVITEDRRAFIARHYPQEIYDQYTKLQIGAAQADFWRLLTLQEHGGVYLDIDAHAIWPLADIIGQKQDELYVVTRRGEISNYFIASKPDNPNLSRLIDQVKTNIQQNRLTNVFEITGPGVFIHLLCKRDVPTVSYRHACHQGSFTNEHFQYIDKPAGKWTREQVKISVIAKEASDTRPTESNPLL